MSTEVPNTPEEVNAWLKAEIFDNDSKKRQALIFIARTVLKNLIIEDLEGYELYKSGLKQELGLYTQESNLDGFARGDVLQKTVSFQLTPPGFLDTHGLAVPTSERLIVHTPVPNSFSYSNPDNIAALSPPEKVEDVGFDSEVYTEWRRFEGPTERVSRWVISPLGMRRYTANSDGTEQVVDEVEELSVESLTGRRTNSRGDVLARILDDFVNFDRTYQVVKTRDQK